MWAKPACGLKNERNEIDVWIPVEFALLRSLGRKSCGYLSNLFFSALLAISPGFVLAAETRDGLRERINYGNIQIRD